MADEQRLAERLRWMRGAGDRPLPAAVSNDEPIARVSVRGFESVGNFTWLRVTRMRNPLEDHERVLFGDPLHRSSGTDGYLFLDTETTGLSGGAGTIAFLVGLGRVVEGGFELRQYFLSDFPGERELLEAVAVMFRPDDTLVTYNGASFDLPLLRTRFLVNGLRLPELRHIDLLRPTRRLWKSIIGPCSLRSVELHVLGIEREEDIPGFLVPELYFEFLRRGDDLPLGPVFAHHREDVVSLARLLARIEAIAAAAMSRRAGPLPAGFDQAGMGRLLVERDVETGVEFLERSAQSGDSASGRAAGLLFRRRGLHERAVAIWQAMWEESEDFHAGIELAKYYEHRQRDPKSALIIVETLVRRSQRNARGPTDQALLHRKFRLERKLANR